MKKFKTSIGSLAFACLIGPLIIIPAMPLGILILHAFGVIDTPIGVKELQATLLISSVGLIYAYPLTILFGVPLFMLLRKLQMDNLVTVVICSQLPVILMLLLTKGDFSSPVAISYFSAIVSVSCWFLYRVTMPKERQSKSWRKTSNK